MAIEIVMPRLGWTMQEGIFGEWLKQDGEEVKSGDLLFTVESDKATQEVENFDNGILRIPPDGPKSGDVIPVGGRLGYIVQPGEAVPFETEQLSQTKQHSPEAAPAPSSQASRAGQSPTPVRVFRRDTELGGLRAGKKYPCSINHGPARGRHIHNC